MAIARRAQFKNIGPAPVPRMTNGKRVLILSLALLFDAIKFMCTQLWFFGPALIGLAGSAAVGGGWVGAAVGTVVGAGSLATLGAGIEALGVILAMAVGLIGWMTMIVIMMGIRMQPFHSRNFISVFFGFW